MFIKALGVGAGCKQIGRYVQMRPDISICGVPWLGTLPMKQHWLLSAKKIADALMQHVPPPSKTMRHLLPPPHPCKRNVSKASRSKERAQHILVTREMIGSLKPGLALSRNIFRSAERLLPRFKQVRMNGAGRNDAAVGRNRDLPADPPTPRLGTTDTPLIGCTSIFLRDEKDVTLKVRP